MQSLRSAFDHIRENYAHTISRTSTFRETGQLTPEEFVAAGDFLVYKFPSWSWADASTPKQRVAFLPEGKQYLVTRGVPCRRRLDENFAGGAGLDADIVVGDGEDFKSAASGAGDEDGWLRTGGEGERRSNARGTTGGDVRTVDEAGEMSERATDDDEDAIPDMEDEDEDDDDEAIIRDPKAREVDSPLRTYTLYIAYSPYYRTPRLYLSGYQILANAGQKPLPPIAMMEDIVADYKDKTVTLEDFPFITPTLKTASIHPCRHASVMKVLLDRADAALKVRTDKIRRGQAVGTQAGMEGLVERTDGLSVAGSGKADGHDGTDGTDRSASKADESDRAEWEDVTADVDHNAVRVDQYLIVFLKFMASVTPGIEHDYTMGV